MILPLLRAFVALCLVSSVSACSCFYEGPKFLQDIYCDADHVIQISITESEVIGDDPSDPFSFSGERRYTITTPIVYKSSSAYNALVDKNSLYTALNGAACGVGLQVGTTYIITGYISGGKLRIGLCSALYKAVGQFSDQQLKYLKSGYDKGCKYCEIQYCQDKKACDAIKLVNRYTCIGYQDGLDFLCRDKYAKCVRKGFWYRYIGCQWGDTSGQLGTCLNQQKGK